MQQRKVIDQAYTNRVLLNGQLATPKWWLPAVSVLGVIVVIGWVLIGFMLNKGLGVTGLNRPVFWGVMIVTFVFWVGISHAGIMISAILRLTQAEWRRPVTRAAELLTVCSLLTALLFPAMQDGRVWRDYWMTPMDFARGVWPNPRSPLIWDPFAIGTYLTGSTLFLYVALIPDIANLRDRTVGKLHAFYTVLAVGWRGFPRQWKLQTIGGILLSALMLPIFVSVHSVVSWDFAITPGVEGWHSTIFAPYFVIGAVHSGVSAVVTIMALMRWMWKWDDFIRPEHFDALARLLIVVATAWLGFTFLELVFALYGQEGQEVALRELQIFTWPWNAWFIVFMMTGYVIPVTMWLFKSVRNNIALMFWTSILVNVGMWLERYFIVVGGLSRKTPFVFSWDTYRPSPFEWAIMGWSFAWVSFLLLLFARFFPLIPLFEQKESQTFAAEIKVGRARVPAILREQE
jgi:molybdopterin-containing oxidoreductase family membrane subunit